MWAIVGLGNPGPRYSKTRHNIGFMVIEAIAEKHKIELLEKKLYLSGRGDIEGTPVVLIKPLTFMNLSGRAVKDVLKRFNIPNEKFIVIHDDMDMETGKIKIKNKGRGGGHKGVESIISSIGGEDFIRVKIGIGRDPSIPSEDYVLSKFKRVEMSSIKEAIETVGVAVAGILAQGIERAMNRFNKRSVDVRGI
ncbi:MAG: aminoacyl-tRNA hydrolase [Nitrospirae bacterium]|nr:aminoacyl-tRNA hydrolase [Nitrospirota bacterium]